jgi:hypothetical protein
MRERGPDQVAPDGSSVATWREVGYQLGPGGLTIVGRR